MGRKRRPADADDPEALYRALIAESLAFREKLAARYGAALSAFLRSLPVGTLAEKREAVRVVNGRLRSLGLVIHCPKTGVAARLLAHPGNHPELGRFQIELLDGTRRRTVSTPDPPPLDLMPEPAGE